MKGDPREWAERALKAAREAGADEAEACVAAGRLSEIKVHGGAAFEARISEESGVGVRLFCGGKTGFFCTSDPAALEAGVRDTARAVLRADEDPCAGLPDPPAGPFREMGLFDAKLSNLSTEAKTDLLVALEREALEADPRIVSKFFAFRDTAGFRLLRNTRGLDARVETTSYSVAGSAAIKEERRGTRGFFHRGGRFLGDLAGCGREAADRALRAFGGRPFPPRTCTVVFDPMLASQFLAEIS
ncbi:MAG: hypothetical protein MUC63_08040, partial [Planctomycetes bacterium]|nr:hypothetical protein [Planctomycetota bacterium]